MQSFSAKEQQVYVTMTRFSNIRELEFNVGKIESDAVCLVIYESKDILEQIKRKEFKLEKKAHRHEGIVLFHAVFFLNYFLPVKSTLVNYFLSRKDSVFFGENDV